MKEQIIFVVHLLLKVDKLAKLLHLLLIMHLLQDKFMVVLVSYPLSLPLSPLLQDLLIKSQLHLIILSPQLIPLLLCIDPLYLLLHLSDLLRLLVYLCLEQGTRLNCLMRVPIEQLLYTILSLSFLLQSARLICL